MRMKLYQLLVNRVPAIRRRYHGLRQRRPGRLGRIYAWAVLLGMNLSYGILRRKWEREIFYPDEKKCPPKKVSESSLSLREAPEEFAWRLLQYDIISFDVFDTLLFRPYSNPGDLFFQVGEKLGYPDFERIRREMEWHARQKAKKTRGSYEVTLEEIYEELEIQAGIPAQIGMQTEIETEKELCFGNPYMLETFQHLSRHLEGQKQDKRIICVSDMYLSGEVIQTLLKKCGFHGIDHCFVSCETGAAKGEGKLFEKVRETYGKDKKYVHVGDHPEADIKMAKRCGFDTEFYQNVNLAGMPYRAEDMSVITGSLYRGIVNTHIHNGMRAYSREYEMGFIYGGLFVTGYCQFIHEYVKCHEIDKVLFLSRDGEILHKAYQMLYPEESGEEKTEYVYWSRLAAAKMAAGYFKYDYFRRFLEHKVNQDKTLAQIFQSMEIEDMLDDMCRELPGLAVERWDEGSPFSSNKPACRGRSRGEGEVSPGTKLTYKNAGLVRAYLTVHWEEVLSHYQDQLAAGKLYYEKVLNGCRRVAAVDVGWAGSGAMALEYIVNKIWNLDCEIVGLLAGTNSVHNAEPNMSEPCLAKGRLVSYLFSQEMNRDIWKWHDAAKEHNLGVELLCSSARGSLKGFYLDKDKSERPICRIQLKEPDADGNMVKEIQRGILDFVEKMHLRDDVVKKVAGSDGYAVMRILLQGRNEGTSELEVGI